MSDLEQQMAQWLDGKLSPEQQQQFEQQCQSDPQMRERLTVAKQAQRSASSFEPRQVPQWNAAATFSSSVTNSGWFNWSGSLSMAMSVAAILMVLFKVEVQIDDGSMTLSFAGKQQQHNIQKIVDEQLLAFKQDQQLVLASFAENVQQQQQLNNAQLSTYLLSSSRQERKEDFGELIKFVNQQRSDDQMFYTRQLGKLQEEMYTTPVKTQWQPAQLSNGG
ncbi:hypothetical protein QX776_15290 [Alteromonadaceae bacterium BrNp21-10]|nr:hypothetical protein [Alteromonadaceae bacterium BrNp21-10]